MLGSLNLLDNSDPKDHFKDGRLAMREISGSSCPTKYKLHINYNQSDAPCNINPRGCRGRMRFNQLTQMWIEVDGSGGADVMCG